MSKQMGNPEEGSRTLGAIEKRYGTTKKLAAEGSKSALSKVKNMKANKTDTGKPADPVELDPAKQGIQNTSLTN